MKYQTFKEIFFVLSVLYKSWLSSFFIGIINFYIFFLLNSISKTLLAWEIEASNIFCVCFFEINRKNDFFIVEIYYWSWCAEIKWRQHDFHFVNLVLLIDFFFSSFSQGFSSVTFYILILYAPHEAIKKWLLIWGNGLVSHTKIKIGLGGNKRDFSGTSFVDDDMQYIAFSKRQKQFSTFFPSSHNQTFFSN